MPTDKKSTVLITGATGAIGSAIASIFASNGWNLLLWYRSNGKQAHALAEMAKECGVKCTCLSVDFEDSAAVESAVEQARKVGPDALVNNAGGYAIKKRFSALRHGEVAAALAVNFTASFLLSSAIFEVMAERGYGRIVNISSVAAKYGGSDVSMQYGCAKRALEGITLTLAREGASKDVLVNTVRPGVVDTDFHERMERDMEPRIQLIPMKRMGTPEEVADLVYCLGSKQNTYITGQTVAISGGE